MEKKRAKAKPKADAAPTQPAETAAKPVQRQQTPSEKLAVLLRKEGLLVDKVKKAQQDLKSVQAEINALLGQREKQAQKLLGEG